MILNLEGKSALVTGASGGIGAAVATLLHSQGAELILTGTRKTELERLADKLGGRTHVVAGNLMDSSKVDEVAEESEKLSENGIDILINNAGIVRDNLLMRMSNEDWIDVINVNLFAGFQLTRKIIRGMMKRRWGRIIGISSVVGVTGNAGQTNYAAAKAGMIGFSKALALEVASRGITVNTVAPGFIETAMTKNLNQGQVSRLLEAVPTGRLGHVGDVAAAVVYLASEEAEYVTGTTLHVNGGMAMP